MNARLLIGDVFDRMAEIPDGSIDCVITSPPFLALRSYLPADHPDKGKEIGSEPNPAEFIDTLLRLTAEWGRLLAPHGSIAVELGDTYSGANGWGDDAGNARYPNGRGMGVRQQPTGEGWPMDKSLCLIPQLYAVALSYGINPLTGEASPAGRWRVRNVVRWCRPNPPVGALGDKFRPATSEMVIATRARDRYFDLDAVREPPTAHSLKYHNDPAARERWRNSGYVVPERGDGGRTSTGMNPAGAPPLDWWEIPTHPYKGSHYATFPPELVVRPIKSMVPERVCRECGEPSRRITEVHHEAVSGPRRSVAERIHESPQVAIHEAIKHVETVGWSDCGHDAYRPGVVLDPFAGSGTTLMVATGHGRDAIGIDIDARNADLARERVGMFLEVDEGVA